MILSRYTEAAVFQGGATKAYKHVFSLLSRLSVIRVSAARCPSPTAASEAARLAEASAIRRLTGFGPIRVFLGSMGFSNLGIGVETRS